MKFIIFFILAFFSFKIYSQNIDLIGKWTYSKETTEQELEIFQEKNQVSDSEIDEIKNHLEKVSPYILFKADSSFESKFIQIVGHGKFSVNRNSIILISETNKKAVIDIILLNNRTELELKPDGLFSIFFKR